MDQPYYLFEQAGALQVLRSDAPQAHWQRIPDESLGALWEAVGENRPVRIHDGMLDIGEAKADLYAPGVWDWSARAWLDSRTLGDLKAEKWEAVKQARASAFTQPLITPFGIFQADAEGQQNIKDAVLLANNLAALDYPVAIDFTLADDSIRVMDAPAMVQVGLLLGGRVQLIRAQATALRDQIAAADSLETLATLVWSYA